MAKGAKDGGRERKGRRPGSAAGRILVRDDFDDPLPEEILDAFEGREDPEPTKYVIVELGAGGRVDRTQTPQGVELVIVDADAYLEPPLCRSRADLEPYERCGSCGEARVVHENGVGANLWIGVECGVFELTGKTLGDDYLNDWEKR